MREFQLSKLAPCLCAAMMLACAPQDDEDPPQHVMGIYHGEPRPSCGYVIDEGRQPYLMPQVVAEDWGEPVKLGEPINSPCPEDAATISRDGTELYFFWSPTVGAEPIELLRGTTGTYRAERVGTDPGRFGTPRFFDLRQGSREGASDGRLRFSPAGDLVYFHSTRWENTGYRISPPTDDYLDLYSARITNGVPGPAVNLGPPVNTPYLDGEHCLSPDGTQLYLSSTRPGGLGDVDIWVSTFDGAVWGEPINIGTPVNSPGADLQPAFAANDPYTIYFVSDRAGPASIFRSRYDSESGLWSEPEMVLTGYVGEPSFVADGSVMYFVHVMVDDDGVFGADIWYVERR